MLKAIAFGLAVGAGVQAWRNFPSEGPVSARSAILVMVVGIVCAYLGGRWSGRGNATAYASASAYADARAEATANQQVNVALIVPGQGAGASVAGSQIDGLPWLEGSRPRPELDQVDGMDLRDLLDERDTQEQP